MGAALLVVLSALLVSVSSYSLVDHNLSLGSWWWLVRWQEWWWGQSGSATLLAQGYVILAVFFALSCLWFWRVSSGFSLRYLSVLLGVILLVFAVGHNALSHDLFNYLFNAKMVVVYHTDPHVQTALDYATDPWTRFMHNVHTPAPYGRGWTYFSLIPFLLSGSGNSFLLTFLAFRFWMVLGFGMLLWLVYVMEKQLFSPDRAKRWVVLAFHPLLLLELTLNSHNDAWFLLPALAAWFLWIRFRSRWPWWFGVLFSLALVALSVWVKLATLVLVPLLIGVWIPWPKVLEQVKLFLQYYWAELSAFLLFLPLLTERSQQFHPWYLSWPLVFVPFMRVRWWRHFFLALSVSSLFRSVPWLLSGQQYTDAVQWQARMITWFGVVAFAIWEGVWYFSRARRE